MDEFPQMSLRACQPESSLFGAATAGSCGHGLENARAGFDPTVLGIYDTANQAGWDTLPAGTPPRPESKPQYWHDVAKKLQRRRELARRCR
ncbi:MAG: hypothetical protein DMG97_40615 [Acidobacteria bacterium]|nr:MAG: hypothetical protein DMG97_40615 [Acidobacteriota bacterium]